MLTLDRGKHGDGFLIKSKPSCLKIEVKTLDEVVAVMRHYYMINPHDEANCPVCKQNEEEERAHLNTALHGADA